MDYFLAIDAGGTKTQCLLADETRVLARAATGSVKLMRVGETEASVRLGAVLAEAAETAGISLRQITRTCFGLAGLSSPAVRAWAEKTVAELVGGELLLCGDEEIALDAAFAGGPGILVVAGTGSNAIGRSATGAIFGAGGRGPVLGDEGSGTWIGLEAIRNALHPHNWEPARPTECGSIPLLHEIERRWGLNSLEELVHFANHMDRGNAPDFSELAPVVAHCAEEGDLVATAVLERAGVELARLASLVHNDMTWGDAKAAQVEVAFTGGVLTHIAPVHAAMTARLSISLPAARVRQSPVDPLDGALWRARRR